MGTIVGEFVDELVPEFVAELLDGFAEVDCLGGSAGNVLPDDEFADGVG